MKTLILGGARSGKTTYALNAAESSKLECVYIATATADDCEMEARIAHHKLERGAQWQLIEEPIALSRVLMTQSKPNRVLLVDCLTLWLSNLLCSGRDCTAMSDALVQTAKGCAGSVIFVSNEVGLGIVPDNVLAREFRDAQGRLNQKLAAACEQVVFIAAGLPLKLKG
jgi:adenosylcobinamide kinase / adenosylcobinamide-phosphate guanylyltransferase